MKIFPVFPVPQGVSIRMRVLCLLIAILLAVKLQAGWLGVILVTLGAISQIAALLIDAFITWQYEQTKK